MTNEEVDAASKEIEDHYKPLMATWDGIRDRCYNPNSPNYKNYGGRGIKMSKLWRNDFDAFAMYMGKKPSPEYSIDRINNDHGYVPGNVRWATRKEQANNTRFHRLLTYDGKTQSVVDWSRETGLTSAKILFRLYEQKWNVEKTLSTPNDFNPYAKKRKPDNQAGYVKYTNADYNTLIELFNSLQRRSMKKLFINRELLKAFHMYVEVAKR